MTIAKKPGIVWWVTGLAGSGKTTIAQVLVKQLQAKERQVVHLDGDSLRAVLDMETGYDPDSRQKIALIYSRMCQMLATQGCDVVCSTISMYHMVRAYNREHIARYQEVYIKVPQEVLLRRDQKGLYSRVARGEKLDVVGANGSFEEPVNPDFVLENDGQVTPEDQVQMMLLNAECLND